MTGTKPDAGHYLSRAVDARLADAAAMGDADAVARAMREGADPNAVGAQGVTPLLWALAQGSEYGIAALLAVGADAGQSDEAGRIPIHIACLADDPSLLDALIRGGAHLEQREPQLDRTPLFTAIQGDRPRQFEALIAAGAQVDARDSLGCTPLHLAARIHALDYVIRLLDAGADPGVRDDEGRVFIDWLPSPRDDDANEHRAAQVRVIRDRVGGQRGTPGT